MSTPAQLAMASQNHPFAAICSTWLAKIELARATKQEQFGKWADEAMQFFDGAHDWMWDSKYASGKGGYLAQESKGWMPRFRMTYNRMFEAVAVIGPALYFQNPNIAATPNLLPQYEPEDFGVDLSNPEDPNVQQIQQLMMGEQAEASSRRIISSLSERYLNWMQLNISKRETMRFVLTDALIKGAGYTWTGVDTNKTSGAKFITSEYVNADDVFKDPDAAYDRDVQWVCRRCVLPLNKIEEKFQLQPGSLKGHIMSFGTQADMKSKGRKKATEIQGSGKSYDLGEFYELYSKNGFGQLLKAGTATDAVPPNSPVDTSQFGANCFLAVMPGVPYPLNLPSDVVNQLLQASKQFQEQQQSGNVEVDPETGEPATDQAWEELFMRAQWPFPAWQEEPTGTGWPFTEYFFYRKPGCVWPLSIFKPVAGEMRFINWAMSFLADRAAVSCQTVVAIAKAAAAEMKSQLAGNDSPFTVIELSDLLGMKISDVVSFLASPKFDMEIWNVIAAVDEKIDKRLALTDLAYGLTNQQMRSAEEAKVRDNRISVRPDDMANSFEDCFSKNSLKELQAAFYLLEGADVAPVIGQVGSMFWDQYRAENNPDKIIHAVSVRVEAGTTRKPNRDNKITQFKEFLSVTGPIMQQLAANGQPGPYNAAVTDYGRLLEVEDVTPYLVQPPPPPEEQGPTPEEQAAQVKLEMEAQKTQVQIQADMQKAQIDLFGQQQQLEMDEETHDQEMRQSAEEHKQKMAQAKATARAAARAKPAGARKA